jgi:putative transposase
MLRLELPLRWILDHWARDAHEAVVPCSAARRRIPLSSRPRLCASSAAVTAPAPDRVWVADITYVPTWAGFLYLAVVLDVHSRRIVGWAMADHLRRELVIEAVDMAVWRRRPTPSVIHHSDQGSQYASLACGRRLREAGLAGSMGSRGDGVDRAAAERVCATRACELLARHRFPTRSAARLARFDDLAGCSNTQRRQSTLG